MASATRSTETTTTSTSTSAETITTTTTPITTSEQQTGSTHPLVKGPTPLSLSNNDLEVIPEDLEPIKCVGSGSFGEVWKGQWNGKGGGVVVAIKKARMLGATVELQRTALAEVGIHIQHTSTCEPLLWLFVSSWFYFFFLLSSFFFFLFPIFLLYLYILFLFFIFFDISVSDILTKLRHPNITTIYGACIWQQKELWIVMEFMEGGSLFDALHSEYEISWVWRLR